MKNKLKVQLKLEKKIMLEIFKIGFSFGAAIARKLKLNVHEPKLEI